MVTINNGSSVVIQTTGQGSYQVVSPHNTTFSVLFTPSNAEAAPSTSGGGRSYGPLATTKTFGPYGIPGTITITVTGGASVTYTQVNGEGVYTPVTNDYNGIMGAVAQVMAAGGGVVKLLPVTYTLLGNSLPLLDNLSYEGSGVILDAAIVPNSGTGSAGGTILLGNGTAPAFMNTPTNTSGYRDGINNSNNENDFAVDQTTNYTKWKTATKASIKNLSIYNVTYGVKAGALFKAGLWYAEISNVHIYNFSQWALWLENMSYSKIRDISGGSKSSNVPKGYIFGGTSAGATTTYIPTNSHYEKIFFEIGHPLQRNFVFNTRATATGSCLNDLYLEDIQVNSNGVKTTSTTATFAGGGSANIALSAGEIVNYPVDMPISVTASGNGVNQHVVYFVVSNNGTNIQIANNYGGTALTFATAPTCQIVQYGYPHLEIAAHGTDGGQIQSATVIGTDLEGPATTQILLQNTNIFMQNGASNSVTQGTNGESTYCLRSIGSNGVSGKIINQALSVYDIDQFSSRSVWFDGFINDNNGAVVCCPNGNMPMGFLRSFNSFGKGGQLKLSLCQYNGGVANRSYGIYGILFGSVPAVYHDFANFQKTGNSSTTTTTIDGNFLGTINYDGGNTAGTWTLPSLSGTAGFDSSFVGAPFEIGNGSTGTGTLTLNTQAGQGFNRTSRVSITINPGASITVRGMTSGGAFWWQVVGIGGTYSAGTITTM